MSLKMILTHPGGSHKDELLACCLMIAKHGVAVVRREPTDEDLDDPSVAVIDVGGRHEPELMNFDHHQFPRDYTPTCALTLVMQHLGIYDDARLFCDWLEPAEWFDTRGPVETAKWLGVEREAMAKLNSPIDITLLRRFARVDRLVPGDTLYEVMSWLGSDMLDFIGQQSQRLEELKHLAQIWEIEHDLAPEPFKVMFVPRQDPLASDPSMGMGRYIQSLGIEKEILALIYPDRRGKGYGLSRFNDDQRLEFTRIKNEPDVRFAHSRGFVAKTDALDNDRLRKLVQLSYVPLAASET